MEYESKNKGTMRVIVENERLRKELKKVRHSWQVTFILTKWHILAKLKLIDPWCNISRSWELYNLYENLELRWYHEETAHSGFCYLLGIVPTWIMSVCSSNSSIYEIGSSKYTYVLAGHGVCRWKPIIKVLRQSKRDQPGLHREPNSKKKRTYTY